MDEMVKCTEIFMRNRGRLVSHRGNEIIFINGIHRNLLGTDELKEAQRLLDQKLPPVKKEVVDPYENMTDREYDKMMNDIDEIRGK